MSTTPLQIVDGKPVEDSSKPAEAFDPFDPVNLRLGQDFAETIGVKKLLTKIPVGRPPSQTFIRTHPDPAYRFPAALLQLKTERESYLVHPRLREELADEVLPFMLVTILDRQNVLRLWPIRLPGPDGKGNDWWASAFDAVEVGLTHWVRVKSNMALGAYEIMPATGISVEPVWPEVSVREVNHIAFKTRYIDTLDHPVVKALREGS
jgi:hypothetical protein